MAPSRRSRPNGLARTAMLNARPQTHARKPPSLTSYQSHRHNSTAFGDDQVSTHGSDQSSHAPFPQSSLFHMPSGPDAFHPIRAMAERVGDEVEAYAAEVDNWRRRNLGIEDMADFRTHTTIFAKELQRAAKESLAKLRKRSSIKPQNFTKTFRNRLNEVGSETPMRADTSHDDDIFETGEENIKKWTEEASTWDLFCGLLSIQYPSANDMGMEQARRVYTDMIGAHSAYVPEADIWSSFVLQNDSAREKSIVLRWLQNAAGGEMDVETLSDHVEEMNNKRKPWANCWLHTREKLKDRKRMTGVEHVLPETVSPPIRNASGTANLTTQMDPDAPMRQNAVLEKNDAYGDHVVWLVTFEMIRRGVSVATVRQWFKERQAEWLGASIGRANAQNALTVVRGLGTGSLFRRTAYATARYSATDEYERAVYGLLSGDIDTVEPVCRTWDDLLYTHYNAILVAQFENHLRHYYPDRAVDLSAFEYFDALQLYPNSESANKKVIQRLKTHQSTSAQAKLPMKRIQAAIIEDNFVSLMVELGAAVAQQSNGEHGKKSKLVPPTEIQADESVLVVCRDINALRTVVHMYLMLRLVAQYDPSQQDLMDNVIISYMDVLRLAGRYEALPLYAAHLRPDRAEMVLGSLLMDIVDPEEQRRMIVVMEQNGINPHGVCSEIAKAAVEESRLVPGTRPPINVFQILEPRDDEESWPGASIRSGLVRAPHTAEEENMIRSVEWFVHLPGQWTSTFEACTLTMVAFLLDGRINGAIEMVNRLNCKSLSVKKTTEIIGYAMDVMEDPEPNDEHPIRIRLTANLDRADSNGGIVIAKRQAIIKIMKRQAKLYYQLTQLVYAVKALHESSVAEREGRETPLNMRDIVHRYNGFIAKSFPILQACMEPLFHDFLVVEPKDPFAKFVAQIRNAYIPEIILAYNSAIYVAGYSLDKDCLLAALELPRLIVKKTLKQQTPQETLKRLDVIKKLWAAKRKQQTAVVTREEAELLERKYQDNTLQQAFVDTQRTGELVEALAKTSRLLLQLNQDEDEADEKAGRKRKRRSGGHEKRPRGWKGETTDIWDVGRTS
ncbi:hypothetical protein K402DRAFT_418963 [Aulographum hederae CBS 113979]|uniref:Nuclear pore complex protein n=1 Tax=Aulographum hederae CBS 113979 TaxID=1176131 RepID=A0A6G1H804_9PEZI|nr:hypothetical protein K402DRAFT_418963 [Aulographum hederae CBS 113979]